MAAGILKRIYHFIDNSKITIEISIRPKKLVLVRSFKESLQSFKIINLLFPCQLNGERPTIFIKIYY